jgi:hypothetical protein
MPIGTTFTEREGNRGKGGGRIWKEGRKGSRDEVKEGDDGEESGGEESVGSQERKGIVV